MKFDNVIKMFVVKNDARFEMHMPVGASWKDAYESCAEFAEEIKTKAEDAAKRAKQEKEKDGVQKQENTGGTATKS